MASDPVVFCVMITLQLKLHGYCIGVDTFIKSLKVPDSIDRAIGSDAVRDMILVPPNKALDNMMDRFGIKHSFETYEGDHVNHVADRFEHHVLPFFSQHLKFDNTKQAAGNMH